MKMKELMMKLKKEGCIKKGSSTFRYKNGVITLQETYTYSYKEDKKSFPRYVASEEEWLEQHFSNWLQNA